MQRTIICFLLLTCLAGCSRSQKPFVKTPLEKAIDSHNYGLVEKMLSEGEDPNEQGPVGITPLECAVYKDDTLMIKLLLNHGANIHEFDPDTHSSLLHACVSLDEFNAAKFLITHGLNPDTPDSMGNSPLISAIYGEDVPMISLLLKYGANPNFITTYKEHPLEIAVLKRTKRQDQTQKLLDRMQTHDSTGEKRRMLGLQIIQILLKSGAFSNSVIPLEKGYSLLHEAAEQCDSSVVQLLLEYGADKDAKDDASERPYDVAVKNNCKDLEAILK